MISIGDLKKIAKARLIDAEALASCHRYEGAVYLCGYVVELGLKNRICKTLKWEGFPGSTKEFKGYQSFKTHNLDILLHLSGVEDIIKTGLLTEWSVVAVWDPESRYNPVGNVSFADVQLMISSSKSLLSRL